MVDLQQQSESKKSKVNQLVVKSLILSGWLGWLVGYMSQSSYATHASTPYGKSDKRVQGWE